MSSKRSKKRKEKNHYKKYRNIIANLTRIRKKKHYKNYFQQNKNNLCKTWQGIKQITLIKKTNNKHINGFNINNMILNDSKSIASKFNEFFSSVAKEIDKICKSTRTVSLQELTLTISKTQI